MIYKEDSYFKYDLDAHRYYITPEYLLTVYGIDLNQLASIREDVNPANAAVRFLKRLSMVLYNYIYEYSFNRELTEYLLNGGNPEWREPLKEAMGEFAYSVYLSGNDFSLETGLSLDKGKELDRIDLHNQMVPASVKNILEVNDMLFRGKRLGYKIEEIRDMKEAGEY